MTRLRSIALVVYAMFAIVVGLYPSALSIGAMLALPAAVLGLVGAVSPNTLSVRPRLNRLSMAALIVFGSELVLVASRLVVTRRRPVELVIEGDAPSKVRVVYGVADGAGQSWSWSRRILVPRNNIAFVRYANNGTWYSADNPHPIRVTIRSAPGTEKSNAGYWTSGGYTEGGACQFEFDEYTIGNRPDSGTAAHSREGWLDSLSTWGVECRSGKLVRSHSMIVPNLRRTGPACYYLPDGAVSCSSAPLRAPAP